MDNMKNLIGTRVKKDEIETIQNILKQNPYVSNLVKDKGTQIGEDEINYQANISYNMDVNLPVFIFENLDADRRCDKRDERSYFPPHVRLN